MSAPPNYNPGDSLLEGGNAAPITPMAGGGGPPPGHDPEASLLRGGTEVEVKPLEGFTGGGPPISQSAIESALKGAQLLQGAAKTYQKDPIAAASQLLSSFSQSTLPGQGQPTGTSLVPQASPVQAPPPTEILRQATPSEQIAVDAALKTVISQSVEDRMRQSVIPTKYDTELETRMKESNLAMEALQKVINETPNNNGLLAAFKKAKQTRSRAYASMQETIGTLRSIEQSPMTDENFVAGSFTRSPKQELYRKVNYEPVTLDAYRFSIRIPDEGGNVQQNWVEGKFTKDEASFLNALHLRPVMLTELFGANWIRTVTIFLRGITTTSCYNDVNLITKSDCQVVRYFLEKIYYWFLTHPHER